MLAKKFMHSKITQGIYKLGIILLLIGFTGEIGQRSFIVLLYEMNKTFITQQYCENKNRPQMHCNGHCFLRKQLLKLNGTTKIEVPNPFPSLLNFETMPPAPFTHEAFYFFEKPIKRTCVSYIVCTILKGIKRNIFAPPWQ